LVKALLEGVDIIQRLKDDPVMLYVMGILIVGVSLGWACMGLWKKVRRRLLLKYLDAAHEIGAVTTYLADRDARVRRAASRTLGDMGAPALEPLIKLLGDQDPEVVRATCDALAHIGAPAVGALMGRLDTEVGEVVCDVLRKIGVAAVEPLIGRLGKLHPWARQRVCNVLGELRDPRGVEPLIARLSDKAAYVRMAAGEALVQMGDPRGVLPVIACLNDENREVRQTACKALGKMGDPRGVLPVIACLNDEHWEVRNTACEALGEMRDRRAVDSLITGLRNELQGVPFELKRHTALRWPFTPDICWALGKLGDLRAVEPLLDCLGESGAGIRHIACEALEVLGESRLARVARRVYQETFEAFSEDLPRLAAEGDLRLVKPFLMRLNHRDPLDPEHRVAKRALDALCPPEALLCAAHLTRFESHYVFTDLWHRFGWASCRVCDACWHVLPGVREVVAVLEEAWGEELTRDGPTLRVNCIRRGTLFDFDRVEIIQANDYEVERFLIAVGNDTDEYRRPRYEKMPCRIGRNCTLSEGTLRNLRDRFGAIVHE
jgi:HEAT repeat protein